MTPRIVRTREATSDPLGKRVTQIQGEVIMAVQTSQRASGTRPPPAMRLAVAMLALWAVEVVAQINPPITGSMGGTDARAVAPTQAQSAPVARPQAVPTMTTTGTPGAATAATAGAPQASPIPANVVRRTTPLRVGEHAADGMLGDETQALLALQASGMAAGPGLPMLGATTTRAHKRYLDSFAYPIPEFFSAVVQNNGAGGGSGAYGFRAVALADHAQHRHAHVRRRRDFRGGDYRLWNFAQFLFVARRAVRYRRFRHGEREHSSVAHQFRYTRSHARPCRCG